MKILYIFTLLILIMVSSCTQYDKPNIIHSDIENYWNAYDKILEAKDSTEKLRILHDEFISKASIGQAKMFELRNYTPQEYINNIKSYPLYWNSIRPNTLNFDANNKGIEKGVSLVRKVYPDMSNSNIYYTVGGFRSPGTAQDSIVLIGSEFALADNNTISTEFEEARSHIPKYFAINPIEKLDFLTVHEYIHTQQVPIPGILYQQVMYEGFAEFVSMVATGQDSPWPAFTYGEENAAFVLENFENQMFNSSKIGNWLWNSTNNIFGTAEIGYYVGYKIAKGYYDQSNNKLKAIKELVELDYNNIAEVKRILDKSGYLSTSFDELLKKYEKNRPSILSIDQVTNGDQEVDSSIDLITLRFSEPMDKRFRGFDYGPMGEEAVLRVQEFLGFSEDGKSLNFKVKLEPNKVYQLQLPAKYRDLEGNTMNPYLIEFKTK